MIENISLAFQGVWGHKLRSFLTMLGVIIGIASIITIVSTINGTNQQIKDNLVGSGTNVVNVRLSEDGRPLDFDYDTVPAGVRVLSDDLRERMLTLEGVESVSLFRYREYIGNVYYKNTSFNGSLYGVDKYYLDTNSMYIAKGRSITDSDRLSKRKVALVDQKTASGLFSGDEVVGSVIEVRGEPL